MSVNQSPSVPATGSIGIDSKRALAAMAAASGLGVLSLYMIPFNIEAAAEGFGVREGTAGIIAALEVAAMAVASMFLAARLRLLVNARLWALLSAAFIILGNLLSLWSLARQDWNLFVASRGVAGLGEGVVLALSSGLVARTSNPDRSYAVLSGFQVILAGASLLGVGFLMESIGPMGAYVAAAGIGFLLGLVMIWTPGTGLASADNAERAEPMLNDVVSAPHVAGKTAVILLSGVLLFNLALSILYPYAGALGANIGMSLATVGVVLSVSAWVALLGPVVGGLTGTRFGRLMPLALGLGIQVAGALVLVYTGSVIWWSAAQVVTSIALQYCNPFLNGLIAFYDPTGQLNAAAASVMISITAVGPLLGGLMLNAGGNFILLGWLSAAGYAISFLILFRPLLKGDRML